MRQGGKTGQRVGGFSSKRTILTVADLDDRKRNSLFEKLSAFEADVDRTRTRFENAMLAFIDIAAVAKNAEALSPVTELVRQINELLGKAKSEEPEKQQIPSPPERKRIRAAEEAD